MAPTKTFHPYPRLPAEIKLMIWECAWEDLYPGAHSFRLTVNSKYPTKLILGPDKFQKDDASAWRERRNLAWIDRYSFHIQLKFERNAVTVYKNTTNNHTVKVEENGAVAMVHAKDDLVTFRFNYGTSLASLTLLTVDANVGTFAGITQIAIERDLLILGCKGPRKYLPFRCPCDRDIFRRHGEQACKRGIINFLQFFKDLKVLYLIYPLTRSYINRYFKVPTESRALCYPVFPKIMDKNDRLDRFNYFQEIALRKNLPQFHDRMGTYCEVTEEDTVNVFYSNPWIFIQGLRRAWEKFHTRNQPRQGQNRALQGNWKDTEFKVLVCCDLRGARVRDSGEDAPLVRTREWF
ncbi:hypothetical protein HD806DRAFT_548791 [Xylariaceae sp. AK1471]|nr:hypothetical protein HD806DRAFT_548791 [Xylariaceae sp. AK1471]